MKLFRFWVCCLFFLCFFLRIELVCADDDPSDPPYLPPPPIEAPVPTIGETTPEVIICDPDAYCYKCDFDEMNANWYDDVPYTKMPCNKEEIAALEEDGWYCPGAHVDREIYAEVLARIGGDPRDIRNLVKAVESFASASHDEVAYILFQEMYKWMFDCMGQTYICDDNEAWPNRCKSLDCNYYGECEWDADINKCAAPTSEYEIIGTPAEGEQSFLWEYNRALCYDCETGEDTLNRCPYWTDCSTFYIKNQGKAYQEELRLYDFARKLLNTACGYNIYVSGCGETYPMCQSWTWTYRSEWLEGEVPIQYGDAPKFNACETDCNSCIGKYNTPPTEGSCFGGDAQYYECNNYPDEDDPPELGESEMCRIAGEDQTPTCISDALCWPRSECDVTCQGFYYCNSEMTPICQLGYYKDLEDCEDKNDGGCY